MDKAWSFLYISLTDIACSDKKPIFCIGCIHKISDEVLMRSKSFSFVLFLFLVLGMVGCKASGGASQYSIFYTPEDGVSELMQENKLEDASIVYSKEQIWFTGRMDDPEVVAVLDALADALEAKYEPELKEKMQSVRGLEWPAGPQEWEQVKARLADLDKTIQVMDSIQLFKNPQFHPPVVDEAKALLNSRNKEINEYAPTAFSQYPLLKDESFFALYPVKLRTTTFITGQKAVWDKVCKGAESQELLHLSSEYGSVLSPVVKNELGNSYFHSLCPSVKKASLSTIITAYGKVHKAGMKLDAIPGVEIAFLEVTSDTLKKKGVIEFPVGVEMDMPFKAINGSLRKGFEDGAVQNADIVILFNLASTKTFRRVDTSNYVKSTYLAGYKQVHNPEWDILQLELQQANVEIMTSSNTALSTNTGNSYTDIGNAIANLAVSLRVDEAKQKVEDLKTKFREVPRFIDEPVYDRYQYQRVEMEVVKSGSVQYYIIDQRSKKYYSDFFDLQSKEFFTVAYDLVDTDPNLDMHTRTNVTETAVDGFETEAVTVKLSELLAHYSSNKGKFKKYSSISSIRKDVIKNRNLAVAKMKKDEYGFDKRDDKRFESVVLVKNSKGLGTGFYVTDDVILTNYHVVREQKFIEMKQWGEKETFGKVFAKDVRLDLALIKIQDRGVPVVFYSKNTLPVGETVEAIGHPLGHEFTLTRGVISTVREHESVMGVKGKPVLFVQTDTPINPGNSGGPLFYGNYVIGVNDWGVSKQIAEGLNFSIHYSEVFKFLDDNNIAYKKGK